VSMVEAWEIMLFPILNTFFTHKEFSWLVDWVGVFGVGMSGYSRRLHSFISHNSSRNERLRSCQLVRVRTVHETKLQIGAHALAGECRPFVLCAGSFPLLSYVHTGDRSLGSKRMSHCLLRHRHLQTLVSYSC
jgi:hypothetical protein